ncbi:MAG: calcium/sodium antiporter [Kiloniellales bacterium]
MVLTLLTLGGLVGLLIGGELVVRGAVATATRLGISPLIIGLTVVAFGTSAPEIVTSVQAAIAGAPALAIGNIVGSNIANVFLVLGLCAVVRPMIVHRAGFRRDALAVVIATVVGTVLLFIGYLDRATGVILVVLLIGYLVFAYRQERRKGRAAAAEAAKNGEREEEPITSNIGLDLLITLGGLVLIIGGAHMLVQGAVGIARFAGLSEATIGATVVAVGTSLPEIVTSMMAALRGQSGVAIGNVMGSNLFNIVGVLGITALAIPFEVPPEVLTLDIWVMAAATLALWFLSTQRNRISRVEGGILLACYVAFIGALLG